MCQIKKNCRLTAEKEYMKFHIRNIFFLNSQKLRKIHLFFEKLVIKRLLRIKH